MKPLLILAACVSAAMAGAFPDPAQLPAHPELPDPLVMLEGARVTTKGQWFTERAPELRRLFQHYEYGLLPPKPERLEGKILRIDKAALGGKATLKEIEVRTTNPDAAVHLLLLVPNRRSGPAPCFLGLNFHGNYTLLADPLVRMPSGWITPAAWKGELRAAGEAGRADEKFRGVDAGVWNAELIVERGYALASFFSGDLAPDRADLARERLADFLPEGTRADDGDAPALFAAWAWGFSRMIDHLATDADIDARRIAVVGHSRNGKTALLAGAMDARIALVIAHQAGAGGSMPAREPAEFLEPRANGRPRRETIASMIESQPHWYCGNFKKFAGQPGRLPFDQHALIALCAPRPVLLSSGTEDPVADPGAQFDLLRAAEPVYRLVCGEGLGAEKMPEVGALLASRLGAFTRPGKHAMTAEDWRAWLDYADQWLLATQRGDQGRLRPPRAAPWNPPIPASPLATATQKQPFENALGMKFVPVPIVGGPSDGQRVLFSVWETRAQDGSAWRGLSSPATRYPNGGARGLATRVIDFGNALSVAPRTMLSRETMKRSVALRVFAFLALVCGQTPAGEKIVPLWPGEPPQFLVGTPAETVDESGHIKNVSVPALSLFLPPPAKRTGMAIILCAGGGYGSLDWKTHVVYAAEVFNPLGVAVIGLKYRLRPPHRLDNAGIQALTLLDAKRAVRTVRHRAAEWGIDPRGIGVAGYSAGANLAMNLAANFDAGDATAADPIERESSRPDFAVGLATWHWRQKESPFVFRRDTPPVFLVHATNDGIGGGAPIELPRAIKADLEKLDVPVRMEIFDEGAHGVGNLIPQRVKNGFPPARWPQLLLQWLGSLPP